MQTSAEKSELGNSNCNDALYRANQINLHLKNAINALQIQFYIHFISELMLKIVIYLIKNIDF